MDFEDRDFEHSPLSGRFTRDGITVEVEIYRAAGTQDPWRLEVADQNGGCTRWHEWFAAEQEAFEAFVAVVEVDGIGSFASRGPELRH
ncbi:hypothetical protein SAMN02799622_03526 [Methylobacterium sp. UNC378MF]|uniref:hypothetical protein n=1 Tax=Methylobacterium sp. UNC378MF TaxID=1502748 RepID=UPI00087EF580|nr:hypothetical protein [Methylobacterium sp. UNC378MF]SDA24986.1 hypothetical protein SAMN02799622_03526 [Methylobacterium sp. UNC378MF]